MSKAQPFSCLGYGIVFFLLAFFGLNFLWEAGRISHQSTEVRLFPTGEVLTNKFWITSGLQGSSACNKLSFQQTSASPQEILNEIPIYESKLDLNQAQLIREKGVLLFIVIKDHIFQHCMSHGKSSWMESTWMAAQGVSEFLNTFPAIHNPLDGRQIERPDLLYHFSSVDDVQSAMITERSSSDNSIPTYLVYTGADYDQSVRKSPSIFDDIGYFFDLERTRAINGLSPPQDPALIIDVSVVSGLDARDLNSPGLATASYPGGKELLRESVALSSTKWKQVNFTTSQGSEANSVSAPSHIDFLFGFSDSTSDTYTLCVRGSNLYGIQYPTAKTNEWKWASTGGSVDRELVFFRIRKNDAR